MGLNLSKNNLSEKAEAGFEFEVTMPGSGEPLGAFITVRGKESKIVQAFARRKFNEMQRREAEAKRRGKEVEFNLDQAEDDVIERAVTHIIGWRGIEDGDGKTTAEVPFTKENAERIMREFPWIREQVLEQSADLLNFL